MKKTKQQLADEKSYVELLRLLQDERQKTSETKVMSDALISSIGDGVIIINEYGNISQVNKAALTMLGYDHDELEGSWLPKTLPSLDKSGNEMPMSERPVVKALLTGRATTEVMSYVKKDGSTFPVAGTASPFMVKGKPQGAIIVFRDFSREISIEKAKDEFVSLASHQLRTPLTSIRIFTELLKDEKTGNLNDEQILYLEKIQESTTRMLDLVSDFLNIARLDLGRLDVKAEPTDLKALIKKQVSELQPLIADKKVKLILKGSKSMPKALIDPALVSQAIHNLISNAIGYTKPGGGEVVIKLTHTEKKFFIRISDNGIGIPESAKSQIFQRLFRADNAIASQSQGTGLGLYLVKKIIEASSGSISYQSEEGVGTDFTICLPRNKLPDTN